MITEFKDSFAEKSVDNKRNIERLQSENKQKTEVTFICNNSLNIYMCDQKE